MALLSGKTGFVLDAFGVSRSFGKWKLAISVGKPKVTNWNSGGFQALVQGIYAGRVSVSGPYDYGNMPFTTGLNVLSLGYAPGVFINVAAIFDLDLDNDVESNPNVSLSGETTGSFGISII